MKKRFKVIVNVNLEYDFNVENEEEARTEVENVELPDSYVSDSFEIVKVMTDKE